MEPEDLRVLVGGRPGHQLVYLSLRGADDVQGLVVWVRSERRMVTERDNKKADTDREAEQVKLRATVWGPGNQLYNTIIVLYTVFN